MNRKKISLFLSAVIGITLFMPAAAHAYVNDGWQKDNGQWYYYENGNKAIGWKQTQGSWYYLNSKGIMETGWLNEGGNWYYLNDNGSMACGWQKINGSWYYLQSSGAMKTGWFKDGGNWYYLNADGSMAQGWKLINSKWYFLEWSGAMKTGWISYKGLWYYLNADGSMAYDTVIDGYALGLSGAYVSKSSNSSSDSKSSTGAGSSSENKKNYTFTEGLNKFCSDSSSIILSSENKNANAAYSPVSFYMALAVLSEGADNSTKTDILNALNVNDSEKLSEECRKLYEKEIFESKNGRCMIADSVWVDNDNKDVEFNEDTLKKIENDYKAGIFKGDLQSRDNAEKISSWILEHTGGLLGGNPQAFVGSPDEVMDIFNTVYFKDRWKEVFDKSDTCEDDFNLSDGSISKADFMCQTVNSKIYEGSHGYKSSSLEFENGHKMMFILPDKGSSVYDIINDKNKLNEALSSLAESNNKAEFHDVYYKLPKFKFSSNIDLNDCANRLGLENIFGTAVTDFTKFSEKGNLCVSKIHQEATVSIDEDGGEAAAFTQISMDCGSAYDPDAKSYDMILDRPFIFAITDKDETPLFVGVVNNPEK